MVDGTKGLGLGPVEAVVAQLSVGTATIAWVVAAGTPSSSAISLAPLVGLAWVLARARERQKDHVLDDEQEPDEQVATDGGVEATDDEEVEQAVDGRVDR